MSLLVLSSSDVGKVASTFSPDELVHLMARVFHDFTFSPSSIHQPQRLVVPTTNHNVLIMPSRMSAIGTATKIVSVPSPGAPAAVKDGGLPASTIVMDECSGRVRAIVNARQLTALRNAAGSLLSARLVTSLKPTGWPRTVIAIGAGAQVSAHLSLFVKAFASLTECTVFNRTRNARQKTLVESLSKEFADREPPLRVESGVLPGDTEDDTAFHDALAKADIIITATSSTVPLVLSAHVRIEAHLCLIGSYTPAMHEVDTPLIQRAKVIIVDSKDACLHEAGELISAKLTKDDLLEIGALVGSSFSSAEPQEHELQKLRGAGDVTIFKSVGLGVQDVAIASRVVERAESEGLGVHVDFDNN